MPERFAVLDVETTGLDPDRDSVVEMACVRVWNDRIADQWSTLVQPREAIPPFATAIHGIDDTMVRHAPTFPDRWGPAGTLRRRPRGAEPSIGRAGARFLHTFCGDKLYSTAAMEYTCHTC